MEKEKVNAENESAMVEAEKCAVIAKEVSEKQAVCEKELAAAEPLVAQAEAALDTLNKKDLGETKSLKKPPPGRKHKSPTLHHWFIITGLHICSHINQCIPAVSHRYCRSAQGAACMTPDQMFHTAITGVDDITAVVIILLEGNPKDKSWGAAQKLMNNVDKFLERLRGYKAVIDEGKVSVAVTGKMYCTGTCL